MSDRKVTISGASGAWGDSSLSTGQLLSDGRSDYIIYEALAEVTMAILSRARLRDPDQGYARDIVETISANIPAYRDIGARVVTNAGGVNPERAAELIRRADPDVTVAVVAGDDVSNLVGSPPLTGLSGDPISVSAYLGARPVAAALSAGADVVVTGRVVDSALALGPLIHEYEWGQRDFDRLAAGSLVGHLLECGPQPTGGLLTDWEDTASWVEPGYPIAVVSSDGSFVVTTPSHTDALVDARSVTEQLLYEIGDPARYLLPDVVCDWSNVNVEELGCNQVSVAGARGLAPPTTLKACAQMQDGWRAQFVLLVGGRDAVSKARRVGEDLLVRGERMLTAAGLAGFRATNVEVLGAEDTYGPHSRGEGSREVVLHIAVHHEIRSAVELFVREVPSIALAGPPGVSGGGLGLPKPSPLIRMECVPIDRSLVAATVHVDGMDVTFEDVEPGICQEVTSPAGGELPVEIDSGPVIDIPLIAIAHGRSGDKGGDVNIGIRARHRDFWPLLWTSLTSARVGRYLEHLGADTVERYPMPGIHALNFVFRGGLGSGGTASLRFDPQGKAVAQQLLDMPTAFPIALLTHPGLRVVPEVEAARESIL